MAHVLFAAPPIRRYHLHERLVRDLNARGHRVTVLCTDAVEATFWSAQGMPTLTLARAAADPMRAPVAELAETECLRTGRRPTGRNKDRIALRLAELLPSLLRTFEHDPPDIVLLHQRRSAEARLIHFVARECGVRILWTGDGCLPHTLQIDGDGLDGDASPSRRSAFDYRAVRGDPKFLAAALASLLARTAPVPLSRKLLQAPGVTARFRDALAALYGAHSHGFFGALEDWRDAAMPAPPLPRSSDLPGRPFVAVLLQREDDERLRLDAEAPTPAQLVRAAREAARQLDREMPVVAILPQGGLLSRNLAPLRVMSGVQLELSGALPDAVATAVAVVTVNHPYAAAGLLAGTPVVHLGRSLYGVPGVAWKSPLDRLVDDLPKALADDQSLLRERFLTWLFVHGHVWCSPDWPDFNGITGLVLEIENRLAERNPGGGRLRYRAGPAWPLAAEGTG